MRGRERERDKDREHTLRKIKRGTIYRTNVRSNEALEERKERESV